MSYVLKTSCWMNIILEISVWHKHWPEFMYICHWPIFHDFMVQWFWLISWRLFAGQSWRLFDGLCCTVDIDSVWHKQWTETIYVGQWPIFHGPVILLYILKTIWWTNVMIGIWDPCDAKIYHIKCMWVSDLYFMVQWFCLISWRLLDWLMLYWRYWFCVTQTLNWNYKKICRSETDIYIMAQWFCLISWRLFDEQKS